MTPERDLLDEMHRWPIDDGTAELLLAGRIDPNDAPPGYAGVAELVRVARGPALPKELSCEATVVPVAAVVAPAARPTSKEIPMRRKLLPFKFAAASVVGAVGFATAAAAVGVTLTSHHSRPNSHAVVQFANTSQSKTATGGGKDGGTGSNSNSVSASPVGPATGMTSGHATFGLCTAFLAIYRTGTGANSPAFTSTAFKTLTTTLGTSTASATAAKCKMVVKTTRPNAAASGAGTTPASHPNATTHPMPPTHATKTTHPGATGHTPSAQPQATPTTGTTHPTATSHPAATTHMPPAHS